MKRLADQTLYEILEVPPDAAPDAITAAYDRVRSLYGPGSLVTYSLMSAEEAAVLTSRIEDAKRTLLDADARTRYDASLADAAVRPEPSNGTNGTSHPPFSAIPIIPALTPPSPPEAGGEGRDEGATLPIPLSADEPSPHAPAPIRLERKVEAARRESAAPVPTPASATVTPAPARPAAAVAPAPSPAQEAVVPMPEGALWSGDALRKVREARGITVPQISERTKVTRHHIENIEGERFSALPASVYLRGILLALARELRLDGQKVARAYLERVAAAAAQGSKPR